MPLTLLAQAFGVHDPHLEALVADFRWIYAHICDLGYGASGLLVYRSTWIEDDDDCYEPVAELLGRSRVEVLGREVVEDSEMIHGHGECSMYILQEKTSAPAAPPNFLDVIHQVSPQISDHEEILRWRDSAMG